ncbi:MAG TPA: hypothetical protein VF884_10305 [Nitrososphaeraceae archaeon]
MLSVFFALDPHPQSPTASNLESAAAEPRLVKSKEREIDDINNRITLK